MPEWNYKTIIEPFKIKMVEPIPFTSPQERRELLKQAGYNLFKIPADKVTLDFLTDSGTSAMSALQWAAVMRGDESYAASTSFFAFEKAVRDIMKSYKYVIPAHQGRAAEKILFGAIGGKGVIIPGNTHFDTTRANIVASGAEAVDLPCAEAADTQSDYPFKGNVDLGKLEALLAAKSKQIPLFLMTITNNAIGGQPVSLENMREAKKILDRWNVPMFIDAARFAENAFFIKQRESAYRNHSVGTIVKEMFALSDGCMMSAKKDAFANIGGFLTLDSDAWAEKCRGLLILTEGFPTYGGLAGRDLEAMAQGLVEVLDEDYLTYRLRSVEYLGAALRKMGVPVVWPIGGHAVYVDGAKFLPHIPKHEFPAHALACALYLEAGIRSCEIGSLAFGDAAQHELLRLAIPRRVYTQSHIDWVIEVFEHVRQKKGALRGYRIAQAPQQLRHFTAQLEPIGS